MTWPRDEAIHKARGTSASFCAMSAGGARES
ncbi:hypothetical protein LMG23992_05495 [Cupriavidus laharis]|uniref:Uncharacterized protein n=1 Tax=Cupriavidus laharis TaxID=151654 RepID=A0ABN7ZLT1_9BURK|nr:hypothetical protein LMG23992_05495 [Cupriavidus laharis]